MINPGFNWNRLNKVVAAVATTLRAVVEGAPRVTGRRPVATRFLKTL
jgi:hypothetical protein